jgi:hypothetical protein
VNFKKLLIVVAIVVAVIGTYKFLNRIDHSNPAAVATAFTKAMKKQDTATAAGFYVPDQADAWRTKIDDKVSGMRSGAKERYFERIPDAPAFGAVTSAAGKSSIASSDAQFTLQMSQIEGRWYVASFD